MNEITQKNGRTYSTGITAWQAVKAVETNSIYNVLIEGSEGSPFANEFYVWDTNISGVIKGRSGWKTLEEMTDLGYEEIFTRDFNNDGAIGKDNGDSSYSITGIKTTGEVSRSIVDRANKLELSYGTL